MRSYLCRGNGRHVDCFTTLLPQSIIEVFQKKVTKTAKVPRESRQLRYRTKNLYCAL